MTEQQGEKDPIRPAEPAPIVQASATVVPAPATPSGGMESLTPTVVAPPPDYNPAGVPSLDFVRDKIEGRYAMSLGSAELAHNTQEARSVQEQADEREEAAREKLAAIRRSLRDGSPS